MRDRGKGKNEKSMHTLGFRLSSLEEETRTRSVELAWFGLVWPNPWSQLGIAMVNY